MELVDLTKLVEAHEASKLEFEYLMCRYEECTMRQQLEESCRAITISKMALILEKDNIVNQMEHNADEWFKEDSNGFVIYQGGEYPYETFQIRELCTLLRLCDLKSWDEIADTVYGAVERAEEAKSEFEEYLKHFASADKQNGKVNLAQVALLVEQLEELQVACECLARRYEECLARLQAAESCRNSTS